MTQQQATPESIDYLAINRARWDERAPHVSTITALPNPTSTRYPQPVNLTYHLACHLTRLPHNHSSLLPSLPLQHSNIRPPPPPSPKRQKSRPPPMPHRNRHPLARPPRSSTRRRSRSQPCQSARSAEISSNRGWRREIVVC
jgi:hypothetical protein